MRVYVNKRGELILAPNYSEKYGGISDNTIQVQTGKFTDSIEKDVNEAMKKVVEKWQQIIDTIDIKVLFEEKNKQIKAFVDLETSLSDAIEEVLNNENTSN